MTISYIHVHFKFNPSRPNPGWREKIKFLFSTRLFGTSKGFMKALKASKGFMKALKAFMKTFWGTTKKCENKNLS